MSNPEVAFTLDQAVDEVLGLLTGMELSYQPELDRYRAITRQLNRALRANALEQEWAYYADTMSLGTVSEGDQEVTLTNTRRARIIGDDAVRLVNEDGQPQLWAYFLPRDALHKYRNVPGLWCSASLTQITFSRPFMEDEDGLEVLVPVMREPIMFRLPENPDDPDLPLPTVSADIRNQEVDFDYPDVVILRAAYYVAQSDPVMQPRAQTLESEYKDLKYQIMERDSAITDTPYQNPFYLPVQAGIAPDAYIHHHPDSTG